VLRLLTLRIVEHGARLATPGDSRGARFSTATRSGAGRAVALLIGARTDRAVALAARAMAGGLLRSGCAACGPRWSSSSPASNRRSFSRGALGRCATRAHGERLRDDVQPLVASARHGRVVHDGLTIALVGPPNAGKSVC